MYQKSPMENFNKNNPFIIIAKKTYDILIDNIHKFSKECIKWNIINAFIALFVFITQIYAIAQQRFILPVFVIIISIFVNICSYICYLKRIKYFIVDHPSIKEFDRISALEVNNILVLNNEDVLKCVHGLYQEYGELLATIKYYRIWFIIVAVLQIALSIISICEI